MAVPLRIPVRFEDVFPAGAFVLGVEPVNDFEKVQAQVSDAQERDKDSGERLWAVRVLDADPAARAGSAELRVKIAAPVQPVVPDVLPGTPFRPVEFEGLTLTPYVDTSRSHPRQAYSLRAHRAAAGQARRQATGRVNPRDPGDPDLGVRPLDRATNAHRSREEHAMTGCARCAELAALAARPTNAVGVPCAHCGVPGWLANPTPGFPYAGCIGCYWGAVARAQLPRDGRDAGHRSASGQSFFDRIRAREPEG